MTEQEWLTATEPGPMLKILRAPAGDRKLRLFVVACCRCLSHLLDPHSRRTIRVAERYADGEVGAEKLGFARGSVRWSEQSRRRREGVSAKNFAFYALRVALDDDPRRAFWSGETGWWGLSNANLTDPPVELPLDEVALLRDLLGNPFRPVTLDPACRTATVLAVAESIYQERRFGDFPVLADAIEEVGVSDKVVLDHFRQQGVTHCRGCWALDLVLGKS